MHVKCPFSAYIVPFFARKGALKCMFPPLFECFLCPWSEQSPSQYLSVAAQHSLFSSIIFSEAWQPCAKNINFRKIIHKYLIILTKLCRVQKKHQNFPPGPILYVQQSSLYKIKQWSIPRDPSTFPYHTVSMHAVSFACIRTLLKPDLSWNDRPFLKTGIDRKQPFSGSQPWSSDFSGLWGCI